MSKYNSRNIEIDGHIFDSHLESRFYEKLKTMLDQQEILFFRLQPRYLLQDAFSKNGKSYRKIEYIADFEIHHLDGTIEVIDVKGFETEAFKLKRKLFEKKYPHKLTLITFSQIDGGWIDLDELKKNRKKRKAVKSTGTSNNRRRSTHMAKTRR